MRTTIAEGSFNGLILKSSGIVIFGHENPDGDSIGSAVGMYHYLTALGKHPHIVIQILLILLTATQEILLKVQKDIIR